MAIGAPESEPSFAPREHAHEWQLRSVEFDDALTVLRYECLFCDEVWFD